MACANKDNSIAEVLTKFVTKTKELNGELLSSFIWGKMKTMDIGDYILEYKGNKRGVMYSANVNRNSPESKNTWVFSLHPKKVEDMAYECARLFLYGNTAYYTMTHTEDVRHPISAATHGGKRRKTKHRTNMRKRRSTRRRKL